MTRGRSRVTAEQEQGRILFVDDEPDVVEPLVEMARELGFAAMLLQDGAAFEATLADFRPTHVVVDLVMPQIDGIDVLLSLSRLAARPHIIVMTGYHWGVMESARILAETHALSDLQWLRKPVDLDLFETMLLSPKAGE
ncbi:hypothetical protein STVA_08500 [Allostella vacuolata]|nr:hypothetical protein STVA_08500 [Stella vacuolata]